MPRVQHPNRLSAATPRCNSVAPRARAIRGGAFADAIPMMRFLAYARGMYPDAYLATQEAAEQEIEAEIQRLTGIGRAGEAYARSRDRVQ